jgi:fructokinase
METPKTKALGFGCVVWDEISSDPQIPCTQNIGGTTLNVVVHLNRLGYQSTIFTAVGDDSLGSRTLKTLKGLGLGLDFVKTVPQPTCLVKICLDNDKNPTFSGFADSMSFDYIETTNSDIDCIRVGAYNTLFFGTVEQRNGVSRNALTKIIEECTFETIFLDLNLREPFYSTEIIFSSLQKCTVAKMNWEEAVLTNDLLGIGASSVDEFMSNIASKFLIDSVVITDAANGVYYFDGHETGRTSAFAVDLVDPVGAGDAFSAGLLHKLAKGESLDKACEFACRMGAMICSAVSTLPEYRVDQLYEFVDKLDLHKKRIWP